MSLSGAVYFYMLCFNYIGFSNGQGYIHQGMRWSTAEGYLQPAMERPNLSVAIQSNVRRVCGFTDDSEMTVLKNMEVS